MYAKVMIGGKETAMLANAASPYLFKQIFHEDFLLITRKMTEEKDQAVSDATASDVFMRMGYVMAMQAEHMPAELSKLNWDTFYDWLGEFEPNAVLMAIGDIANVYRGQENMTSVPKIKGV